jgi:uroporphyrinogen-III synthase
MGSLTGRTIALPETRQLDLMARMVEEEGGQVVRCPLVAVEDAPDPEAVATWIRDFIERPCDLLILYTGEGVRRLMAVAATAQLEQAFVGALRACRKITRGPKPVRALRELGLDSDLVAPAPTTEGLIEALSREALAGRVVGVQLFGADPAEKLTTFLRQAGAAVRPVSPYRYAPAADEDRVESLVRQMSAGTIDLIAFTSAAQVERLFAVVAHRKLDGLLQDAWTRTRVAAVGPVAAESLRHRGVRIDVVPERTFTLKPLVRAIAAAFDARGG